jgi:hypothetical protein
MPRRKPPIIVRFTQAEAIEALRLKPDAPLVQYAEAAGIALGQGDTLSESQIRAISDYLDGTMADPQAATIIAARSAALKANPPVRRRGGLNPEAIRKGTAEVRG